MSLTLSNLKPAKGATKKRKDIGRGGKKGSYSGRGMKGQKARSGGKSGLKAKGFKEVLRRIPKKRGFTSLKKKLAVVNLSDLELKFNSGDTADKNAMIKLGLLENKGQFKVLAKGKITKKLTVIADAFSETAKKAIEEAGGKAEVK